MTYANLHHIYSGTEFLICDDGVTDTGMTILRDGTNLGSPVSEPHYSRSINGETVTVTGETKEIREQSLAILIEADSEDELTAIENDMSVIAEMFNKRGGGYLEFRGSPTSDMTKYRVRHCKIVDLGNIADHDALNNSRVTLALLVDVYALADLTESLTFTTQVFPLVLSLDFTNGGTVDALAGVHYTNTSGTAPIAMMYAWWAAIDPHNYMWNGDAEAIGTTATTAYSWGNSAVAGVISAATSITRTVTAGKFRSGVAGFEVITPATTDTGAWHVIRKRGGFKAGVTYTAQCYVKAISGTTAVRIKLGNSGDIATGTASALTSSFVIRTVTWTPAADTDTAHFVIGVNAATATTFQFDDVMVYEGLVAPTCEKGGFGPGIIPGAAYNQAFGSLAGGTAWTLTIDADYLIGSGPQASGSLTTNGNLEYPILPHLFTPDDYSNDEIDMSVFARIEVASTQASLACEISLSPERGTSYGARRYGSYRAGGKTLKLPSSGTRFKLYYLGKITVKVNAAQPRREWLRLAFTNSGSASGTLGVDYIAFVPTRSIASTQRGELDAVVPDFISSTNQTTKVVGINAYGEIDGELHASILEGTVFTPDDGLCGESIRLPKNAEMLVMPSDQIIDLADSSAHSMAETFTGTVKVEIQPRFHLFAE